MMAEVLRVARLKKWKVGDRVTYNVVTEQDYYNVGGKIVKANKDGTFDVDTGMVIDRGVEPEMFARGLVAPAGVIRIKSGGRK
jgi:hypothetical protein